MEESLAVIRGKEGVLGARQKKKGTAASMISSNQNLKGNYQHLEVDEKWNSLSKKEKQFCIELNMKPTSYCYLKR